MSTDPVVLHARSATSSSLLDDELAVRNHLPDLVAHKVIELMAASQSTSQKVDWTTLRIRASKGLEGALILEAKVELADA